MIGRSRWQSAVAAFLAFALPLGTQAQAGAPRTSDAQPAPAHTSGNQLTAADRRNANRIYLDASKLYVDGKFEEALAQYQRAIGLDPANADYRAAAEVVRSHLVAALIQAAARNRLIGDASAARANLQRALELDPENQIVTQHLYELGDDLLRGLPRPLYEHAAGNIAVSERLLPNPEKHSFHLRSDSRRLLSQVFSAYGVTAIVDDTVLMATLRFDVDDADFNTAAHLLSLATATFYVPIDPHRVLVARDSVSARQQFTREDVETVYLHGLKDTELTDAVNMAKNVFGIQQVAVNPNNSSLTLRGAPSALESFNTSMQNLLQGMSQVIVDVRILQVGHIGTRNTGANLPQTFTVYNIPAEYQSIYSANKALVDQIISSGLAAPGDIAAILGILAAAGAIPSSMFAGGIATFGGGLTYSALVPGGTAGMNLSLNSADSRALDNIQLRLGDGEAGTIKEGTRYPIQTAAYVVASGLSNIAGLTSAGNSSDLAALLSSVSSALATAPMIQYQDLGLTLKLTPKVLRAGQVALTADLTIDALAGSSLNGNPVLNHQSFSGVVTVKESETVELASQLDQSESRAMTGMPGLGDIPGLRNALEKNVQKNYATLLILLTPHVVRSTQPAGQTPRMVVQKGLATP